MTPRIRIAPSLLAADFSKLHDEVRRMEDAGADLLHLDIMDGHFVPNLTMGPVVVESVRKITRLPLDCHLMIMEPERHINAFAEAGADSITFHAEALAEEPARKRKERGFSMQLVCTQLTNRTRLDETIGKIRARGKKVGVAINPDTDAEVVEYIDRVDMILAMTVWPGFGGQTFIDSVLPKVSKLRRMSPSTDIQVDGGLNPETVKRAAAAGANVIVAGTATFRAPDARAVITTLRKNAEEAWRT